MIVSLWNRDLQISPEMQERLTNHILDHLSRAKGERQSISHMIQDIRQYRNGYRIKFPTSTNDAEEIFKALGFTLVKETDARGTTLRTYVTV